MRNLKHQHNQKGFASVEVALLLFVFIMMFTFSVGFFSVIHSGILHSIAARAYTWETMNLRANVTYFRDTPTGEGVTHYKKFGFRLHTITDESNGSNEWIAPTRQIKLGAKGSYDEFNNNASYHNSETMTTANFIRPERASANPVWLKTNYGICLNAKQCPEPKEN